MVVRITYSMMRLMMQLMMRMMELAVLMFWKPERAMLMTEIA